MTTTTHTQEIFPVPHLDSDEHFGYSVWESTDRDSAQHIAGFLGPMITKGEAEIEADQAKLRTDYPGEQLWISGRENWTPAFTVQAVIDALQPSDDDIMVDLGCGYGFPSMYAAMTTGMQCRGVELVPQRIRSAQEVAEQLRQDGMVGSEQLVLSEGSALDTDLSDGTIFYVFNSFSRKTLNAMVSRLDEVAGDRPITVVSRGFSNPAFRKAQNLESAGWLFYRPSIPYVVEVFSSQKAAE